MKLPKSIIINGVRYAIKRCNDLRGDKNERLFGQHDSASDTILLDTPIPTDHDDEGDFCACCGARAEN